MATVTTSVCDSFHGSPGDTVNFTNPTSTVTYTITPAPNSTWPFTATNPESISVPPAGGNATIANVPNAIYYYDVSPDCPTATRKTLTIP